MLSKNHIMYFYYYKSKTTNSNKASLKKLLKNQKDSNANSMATYTSNQEFDFFFSRNLFILFLLYFFYSSY